MTIYNPPPQPPAEPLATIRLFSVLVVLLLL